MDYDRPKRKKVIVRSSLYVFIAVGLGTMLALIVRDRVILASIEAQIKPSYWLFLLGVPMFGAGVYLALFRIVPKLTFQKLSWYDVLCVVSLTVMFLGLTLILSGSVFV